MDNKLSNRHPKDWTIKELMQYCITKKLCKEELIGSMTKAKLVEIVLNDEIEGE